MYEYLTGTVMELQTKIKTQNIVKSIYEYRKNYQAGSNLVKENTGDMLVDYHSILDIIVSYTERTYVELMVLRILICIQTRHQYRSLQPLKLEFLMKS
jgi:hypothetical protein